MELKERKFHPKFRAIVRGTRIIYEDPRSFESFLVPMDGKDVEVTVKIPAKDRSRQEEKFYHAVVVRMVAEAMCVLDQEAHEFLKRMFLRSEEQTIQGYRYERIMSTTELSDKAYREYWETCIRWAALPTRETGLGPDSGMELYIPYPNEVDYTDY